MGDGVYKYRAALQVMCYLEFAVVDNEKLASLAEFKVQIKSYHACPFRWKEAKRLWLIPVMLKQSLLVQ